MDLLAQLEAKRLRIAALRSLALTGASSSLALAAAAAAAAATAGGGGGTLPAPNAAHQQSMPLAHHEAAVETIPTYDKAVETPPIAPPASSSLSPSLASAALGSGAMAAAAASVNNKAQLQLVNEPIVTGPAVNDVAPLAFSLTQAPGLDSLSLETAANDNDEAPRIISSQGLSSKVRLFDAKHSKLRSVMGMEFCPIRPELLLVAYSELAEADWQLETDPDGVALLWNVADVTAYSGTVSPEKVLQCEWGLTSCTWSVNGLVVLAGAVNGNLCMWDVRLQSSRPVHVVRGAHSFPVVGIHASSMLTTLSSDGKLCVWDAATLDLRTEAWRPTSSVELKWDKRDVGVCCMAVLGGGHVIVGCEAGLVYMSVASDGITFLLGSHKHGGPVSSLSVWPHPSSTRLVLSSSLDWTCKLQSEARETTMSLDNMVADCKFSPVHPGLFASVDADGKLIVWLHSKGDWTPAATAAASPFALRRVAWTKDGSRICTGSTLGVVRIFDLAEELSLRGSSSARERERVETAWSAVIAAGGNGGEATPAAFTT